MLELSLGLNLGSRGGAFLPLITAPQNVVIFGDSITQAASTNSSDNTNIISAVTKANPGVVTKVSHGYTTGDSVYHWGVRGMTQVNEVIHSVTNSAANTYSLGVDTSAFTTYVSGGRSFRIKNAVLLHTAQGWMSAVNMLSGQRYAFQHKNNRGISGNTTTEMAARISTDVPASLGATILVIMGGTNDTGTTDTTPSKTPAQIVANLQSCITYGRSIGANVVIGTVPPNSNNNAGQLDDRDATNALVRALEGSGVILWDYWADVADPVTRFWKTGYSYDGTHPSPLGGFVMAQSLEAALARRFGRSKFALQAGNLLLNPGFTGTAGTISANTTGVIADSWITEAATASGVKTFSKAAGGGQVIAFNFGSGLTTGERISMRQSVTSGLVVGTSYVTEMELTLDSWAGTGTLYEISLNLRNQSSAWGTDNSKRNTDPLAVTQLINASGQRTLLLRTPAVEYLTGWTELRPRLDIISKCDTGTSIGQVTVKNAHLYSV